MTHFITMDHQFFVLLGKTISKVCFGYEFTQKAQALSSVGGLIRFEDHPMLSPSQKLQVSIVLVAKTAEETAWAGRIDYVDEYLVNNGHDSLDVQANDSLFALVND